MGSGVADTLRVPRRDAGIVGSGISNLQRQNAGPSACLSLCLSNKYRNLTNTVLYQDLVGKLRAGLELSSIPGPVAHILAASLDIYLCVCVCAWYTTCTTVHTGPILWESLWCLGILFSRAAEHRDEVSISDYLLAMDSLRGATDVTCVAGATKRAPQPYPSWRFKKSAEDRGIPSY